MDSEFTRDDVPNGYNLSRRKVLLGGIVLVGVSYLGPALPAWANTLKDDAYTSQFMQLSHLLVNHKLDPIIGQQLAVAMKEKNIILPNQVVELLSIGHAKKAIIVEDFFEDIPEGPLKDSALAIISAWYKGVLIDVPNEEVFAYEKALMYQPTIDVMTIPSYAITGPNGWNARGAPLDEMPSF